MTDRQKDGQTDEQADRQTDKQTDRQTDRQTDSETDRQTVPETDRKTLKQILDTYAYTSLTINSLCLHPAAPPSLELIFPFST